jgi:hypothetical protein
MRYARYARYALHRGASPLPGSKKEEKETRNKKQEARRDEDELGAGSWAKNKKLDLYPQATSAPE